MAYADWTFRQTQPSYFSGGADILGVAHTLAGAGDRLRRVAGALAAPEYTFHWGSLAFTALQNLGGSGVNAVRQEAWFRYTQAARDATSEVGTGICLAAKAYYSAGMQVHPVGRGYTVTLGRTTGGTSGATYVPFSLRLCLDGDVEISRTNCAGFTPTQGVFYGVRLDCIPLSSTKDVVRVYTASTSPGEETWTQQAEVFPEQGMGNGYSTQTAFGCGYYQAVEVDAAAQMDIHRYRALVMTGGPYPDQE